ncbi:MAG: hypothetical protein KKH94_01015 [Candidatus Omnitrophica bacterium]|nr:hypothetical protein [Candidatus Omnitrophota bacterium]
MVKRCQVLITDWQEEYIRYISKKHDYSFTETVRMLLSLGIMYIIPIISSKYKTAMPKKKLLAMIKNVTKDTITRAERDRFLSIVHFEAMKAVEYRLRTVKKRGKKNLRKR